MREGKNQCPNAGVGFFIKRIGSLLGKGQIGYTPKRAMRRNGHGEIEDFREGEREW